MNQPGRRLIWGLVVLAFIHASVAFAELKDTTYQEPHPPTPTDDKGIPIWEPDDPWGSVTPLDDDVHWFRRYFWNGTTAGIGTTGLGLFGFGVLGHKIYEDIRDDKPYTDRGKRHENNCHRWFTYLGRHKQVVDYDEFDRKSREDALMRFAQRVDWGTNDIPTSHRADGPILLPRHWMSYAFPGSMLALGAYLLKPSVEPVIEEMTQETEEERAWREAMEQQQELIEAFYEQRFEVGVTTEAQVRALIAKDPELRKRLAAIYGDERADRIILAILESDVWKTAIREMVAAKDQKELRDVYSTHKPKLDEFLKKFANRTEAKGRSDIVFDHLGIRDVLSGNEWDDFIHEESNEKFARALLERPFFDDKEPLPTEHFPNLERLLEQVRREVYDVVSQRNNPLPRLEDEQPYKEAKFIPGDPELLNQSLVDDMMGIREVRAFMPEATQDLIDDLFGESNTEMADQLLIEMATEWEYPDLMIDYRQNRDKARLADRMKEEVEFMRKVFKSTDPTQPMPSESVERVIQWTAVHLVLFKMLEEEVPVADPRAPSVARVLEKARQTLDPPKQEKRESSEPEAAETPSEPVPEAATPEGGAS